MEFRNYCIIVMGETKGCKIEIVKIAEDTPRFLEAKGVTIATFLSVAEPGEITEYFKTFNRNFLVFDLDKNSSGFNLTSEKIQDLLFGHLNENENSKKFQDRTNKLIDEINNKVSMNKSKNIKTKDTNKSSGKYKITDDMSKEEMTHIINQILDKGTDNFTEYDRKILANLSERTGQTK